MTTIYDPNRVARLLIGGAFCAAVIRTVPVFVFLMAADPAFGLNPLEVRSDSSAGSALFVVDIAAALIMFLNAIVAAFACLWRPGRVTAGWARRSAGVYLVDNLIYGGSYVLGVIVFSLLAAKPDGLVYLLFAILPGLLQAPLVLMARAIRRQTAWSADRSVTVVRQAAPRPSAVPSRI